MLWWWAKAQVQYEPPEKQMGSVYSVYNSWGINTIDIYGIISKM